MSEQHLLFKQIEAIAISSKKNLDTQYFNLIETPFNKVKKSFLNRDIENVGLYANNMLAEIKKAGHLSLHKELGNAFIKLLNSPKASLYIATIHKQLAVSYDMEKNFKEAEKHLINGIKLAEPLSQKGNARATVELANLWHNRSQQKRNKESDKELIEYAQKALSLYEQVDEKRGIMLSLNSIACMLEDGAITKRLEIYDKIKSIAEETGDVLMREVANINIGAIKVKSGAFQYGINLIENAIKIFDAGTSKTYVALAIVHLAEAFAHAGRIDEAIQKCKEAEQIFKTQGAHVYNKEIEKVKKIISKVQKKK